MTTPASAVSHDRQSDSASRAERLVAAEDAFTRGDFVAAEASTRSMLADDPTDGRALLIAGAIALARHAHRDALDLTDRAIAAWRDGNPPASLQHNRGIALGGMGRLDEAVEALAAAVSVVPNHRQYRTSLAMLLHAAGRREESFEVAAAASGAPPARAHGVGIRPRAGRAGAHRPRQPHPGRGAPRRRAGREALG